MLSSGGGGGGQQTPLLTHEPFALRISNLVECQVYLFGLQNVRVNETAFVW